MEIKHRKRLRTFSFESLCVSHVFNLCIFVTLFHLFFCLFFLSSPGRPEPFCSFLLPYLCSLSYPAPRSSSPCLKPAVLPACFWLALSYKQKPRQGFCSFGHFSEHPPVCAVKSVSSLSGCFQSFNLCVDVRVSLWLQMLTLKTINDNIVLFSIFLRFFLVVWNLLLFFKAPLPAVHLYLAPPCRTAACRLILVTRVMFLSCVWCLIFQSFNTTQGNQSFYWLSVKDARWGRRRISYWTVIGFPEMPPPVQMSSFIQAYISIRAALSGSKIREAEIKNGHGDLWRGTVHSDSATSQRKSRRGRHHQKHSSNMTLSAVSDKSVRLEMHSATRR